MPSWLSLIFLCTWKQDGATLMHYAVQTASSQTIKILLLYNVDINLQDNVWLIIFPLQLLYISISRSFVMFCLRTYIISPLSGWVVTITCCCSSPKNRFSEAFAY